MDFSSGVQFFHSILMTLEGIDVFVGDMKRYGRIIYNVIIILLGVGVWRVHDRIAIVSLIFVWCGVVWCGVV